eukprot:gene4874-5952_t
MAQRVAHEVSRNVALATALEETPPATPTAQLDRWANIEGGDQKPPLLDMNRGPRLRHLCVDSHLVDSLEYDITCDVMRFLERCGEFNYVIIAGRTGSAKGKLLDSLQASGAQVLDLEGAASHRGSILGQDPATNFTQPSQKLFDSRIFHQMQYFETSRPVFVEGESSKVGIRHVPQAIWMAMKVAKVVEVHVPMPARVAWIRAGYEHFETTHVSTLKKHLKVLARKSPGEYEEDRVLGAISTPVLDDEERARVGTLYKQRDPFHAKKVGSALVAANLSKIIEEHFMDREKGEKVLVYCWRGGERSLSLAHTLCRIGFDVTLLQGGYRAYRQQVEEGAWDTFVQDILENHYDPGYAAAGKRDRDGPVSTLTLQDTSDDTYAQAARDLMSEYSP